MHGASDETQRTRGEWACAVRTYHAGSIEICGFKGAHKRCSGLLGSGIAPCRFGTPECHLLALAICTHRALGRGHVSTALLCALSLSSRARALFCVALKCDFLQKQEKRNSYVGEDFDTNVRAVHSRGNDEDTRHEVLTRSPFVRDHLIFYFFASLMSSRGRTDHYSCLLSSAVSSAR